MASALSNETIERHATAVMVVLDIYPQIMREMICNTWSPKHVLMLIQNEEDQIFMNNLTFLEKKMISEMDRNGYNNLDISCLYKVIRHFNLLPPPKQRWGQQPNVKDIGQGADVERMKRYRNDILHRPRGGLSESERNDFFQQSIKIAKRIDSRIGSPKNGFESRIEKAKLNIVNQEKYNIAVKACAEYQARLQDTAEAACFNLYYGNDIRIKINDKDKNKPIGNTSSQCTIYLKDADLNANDVIQMLDATKEKIRKGDYITLNDAESGSLNLHVTIHERCFMTKEILHKSIQSFLYEFFSAASIPFKQGHIYTVVLAESIDLVSDDWLTKRADFGYLKELPSPILKFNVKVNDSAFRNEFELYREVNRFISGRYIAAGRNIAPVNGSTREVLMLTANESGKNGTPSLEHVKIIEDPLQLSEVISSAKLCVVAMDFGTTYSGYAFSRYSSGRIYTCDWKRSDLNSRKTPTSVLLDKDKQFVAFGYEAENKYLSTLNRDDSESDSDDEDNGPKDEYHYFERFDMIFHTEMVNLDSTIKDQTGFQMKACDIFSIAIKYMKDEAIRHIIRMFESINIRDIYYVLTVPGNWDDQSKIFMRKAAEKAGINDEYLMIAMESETAVCCCDELLAKGDINIDEDYSEPTRIGTKYLVIDLAGGTADITVHERQLDGSLEEVIPLSGGCWGGMSVDHAYLELLNSVFTREVIEELRLRELEDYTNLFYQFEVKKRTITTEYNTDIVITLPVSLYEITKKHCTSVLNAIQKSIHRESVSCMGQKLFIKPETFRKLFKSTIDSIIKHVEKLLKHPKLSDLHTCIMMIGGFSECELVQKAMRQKFPRRKIIIPDEAGLVVLRGAVLLGQQPNITGKRI